MGERNVIWGFYRASLYLRSAQYVSDQLGNARHSMQSKVYASDRSRRAYSS